MPRLNYRTPRTGPEAAPEPADCGRTAAERPVELSWSAVPGATSYEVQVLLPDTAAVVATYTSATTSVLCDGLSPDTSYLWQVRGLNRYGEGPWSTLCGFRTRLDKPDPPALTGPTNGTGCITADPVELVWRASPQATEYRVEIAGDPSLAPLVTSQKTTSASFLFQAERGRTYYWRVVGVNTTGETASEIWSFSTAPNLDAAPTIVSPGPVVSVACTGQVDLVWSAVPGAPLYEVVYREETTAAWTSHTTNETHYLLQEVFAGRRYLWQVRALACPGGGSNQPPPVDPPPTAPDPPAPLGPADGDNCIQLV